MFENGIDLRKLLVRSAWVLAAVFVIIQLFNYLTTARITITTDNPKNYTKVEGILGGPSGKFSKQKQGKLSVRVKSGRYQLSVYDEHGVNGSSQTIAVKALHNQTVHMNPGKTTIAEPVYGRGATGVIADSSRLLFIDSSDNKLKELDSQSNINTLFRGLYFAGVAWANPDLGLAQAKDGTIYLIKSGSATPLQLPVITTNQAVSYAISKNGTFYVAVGGNVYSGKTPGNLAKIYSSSYPALAVSAEANKVAVLEKAPAPQADEGGSLTKRPVGNKLSVLGGTDRISKSIENQDSVSWSPDGKYLLVGGRSGAMIFDNKLNKQDEIHVNGASLYTWVGNNAVAYTLSNPSGQLWLYNTADKRSQKSTSLAMGESLTGIYPSTDGTYVYFSDDNGEKLQLFRVGLKGQQIDSSLLALSSFLPETLNGCTINYINFTRPLLLATYPPGVATPDCTTTTKNELLYYGLDPNKIQIVIESEDV